MIWRAGIIKSAMLAVSISLLSTAIASEFDDHQTPAELLASARQAMTRTPADALTYAHEAETQIVDEAAGNTAPIESNDELATALWLQAEAYHRLNQPAEAIPVIERAFEVVESDGSKIAGRLLISRGRVARALGDPETSLEVFQNAYQVFTALDDARYRAICLESLGILYSNAQQNRRALEYFERAAAIYPDDPVFNLNSRRNRAKILLDLGDVDAARGHLLAALEGARDLQNDLFAFRVLTLLTEVELASGNLDAAGRYIQEGKSIAGPDVADVWLSILFAQAAEMAIQQGNLDAATEAIDTAFDAVDLQATSGNFKNTHDIAYRVYSAVGESELALAHLEAYKRLDDADRDVAASANLAIVNAEFELSLLRSERLEADVALIRARRQQERIIAATAVVAILAITGFLGWWAYQSRSVRKMTEAMNRKLESVNHKLRRSNVELEKANLAKTEFLATTSHEVRTPLNAVINLTEIVLQDTPQNTDAHEKLATALRSAQHLHAIVSDVLDVARFEGNRVSAHYAAMNIEATLLDVAQLWRPKAEEKGLIFSADISVGKTPFVTDEKLLRQVLSNLLSNAIKFTDKGSVRMVATGGNGDAVTISVQDSGIGIPDDKQDIIFESFRQVETGGTRSFSGTGLGLAICRRISELLGGSIGLDSTLGEGSTFKVVIPAAKAGVSAPLKPVEPSTPSTDVDGALSSLRILAAEDNAVNAMVIQAILKAKIDSLTIVENGREAVDAVSNGDFDVVLMDKQMPVMDGVEATKRIRALDRPASSIPIIAVTADAFTAAQDELLAAGADRYLAKPIKPDDLKKTIVDVVNGPDDQPSDELVNS